MDLNGIAKAYQLVYEKKADKDYDGDGKIESGTAEYMGSKDKAIKKAMGKKVKHDCSSKVKHEEYGIGDCIKEMHTLDSAGNVTHYDVMFEHGMEKNVFVGDLSVLVSEMHEHVINTDKNKEVLGNKDLMSAYYSMYEHHQKDADGNVIPHEDEEEVKESIDLSFVDELSEEELDTLVEGVVYDLLEEGIELDAIEGAFTEYLEEAKVTYGSDTENPMVAAVKKKKEEKAKASKEKAEKFKKSVGKAVTGMKAKMHGGMADYAGKRGLMPTKAAAAAKKPKKTYMTKKLKQDPEGEKKYASAKAKEAQDLKKYNKVKDKKQTSGNIKVSMMGGGAKDTRSKLRSAVFKDVKDRVGKKTKAVIDAPKKVGQGIRGLIGKGKKKIGRSLVGLGKKMQEQGGELDAFDTVTAYLIDEGLVKDFDHAQRVMSTLDSTLIEEVHAEQIQLLEAYGQDKPGYGKGGDFSKVPTSLHGKMKVVDYDIKHNTEAGKRFKAGNPAYKKESLEDAYQKIYNKDA